MSDEILKELIFSAWKDYFVKIMGTQIGLPETDLKFIEGFKAGLKSVSELELEITKLKAEKLELEKEKARLILHIDDIEKCNDNCQAKIAILESEITKLKQSR